MIPVIIIIVLFAAMLVYFRIADKFNIIDKPNERSSHNTITLRGGGIIFPIAMLLFYFVYGIQEADTKYLWLMLSTVAISIVSFWDDVSSLPNKIRILVHLLSVTLLMYAANAFNLLPIWLIPIAYVLIIGVINAYNFMDGINGITGVYSLVVLISCFVLNAHFKTIVNYNYILFPILACIVFLFFNFRKKAKCFAGDVGSVSIGFWIISLLLMFIIATGDVKYIFFLSVYGVDAIFTIIHRLLLKQNIFEAHRLHFYQILVNQRKVPHLLVATCYGLLQFISNAFIIHTTYNALITGLVVCLPLALIYIFAKPRLMKPFQ